MAARLTADQVRVRLHALGVRRRLLRAQHQQLLDDTASALALARADRGGGESLRRGAIDGVCAREESW
jgi:hypothetical protein